MSNADFASLVGVLLGLAAIAGCGVVAFRRLPVGAGPASGPMVCFPAVFGGALYGFLCYGVLRAYGRGDRGLQVCAAIAMTAILFLILWVLWPKRRVS